MALIENLSRKIPSLLITAGACVLYFSPVITMASEAELEFYENRAIDIQERVTVLVDILNDSETDVLSEIEKLIDDAKKESDTQKAINIFKTAATEGLDYSDTSKSLTQSLLILSGSMGSASNSTDLADVSEAIILIDEVQIQIWEMSLSMKEDSTADFAEELDQAIEMFDEGNYKESLNLARDVEREFTNAKNQTKKNSMEDSVSNLAEGIAALNEQVNAQNAQVESSLIVSGPELENVPSSSIIANEAKTQVLRQLITILLQLIALKQAN